MLACTIECARQYQSVCTSKASNARSTSGNSSALDRSSVTSSVFLRRICSPGVSICTFVLVQQRKLSTCPRNLAPGGPNSLFEARESAVRSEQPWSPCVSMCTFLLVKHVKLSTWSPCASCSTAWPSKLFFERSKSVRQLALSFAQRLVKAEYNSTSRPHTLVP